MQLVYTHENSFLVENAKALLENAGIAVVVKNEFAGGARGDIPAFDTWPELWVSSEDQVRAQNILSVLTETDASDENTKDWQCQSCHETNFANFTQCWNCQAAHLADDA